MTDANDDDAPVRGGWPAAANRPSTTRYAAAVRARCMMGATSSAAAIGGGPPWSLARRRRFAWMTPARMRALTIAIITSSVGLDST
jgi:hypothetical protein